MLPIIQLNWQVLLEADPRGCDGLAAQLLSFALAADHVALMWSGVRDLGLVAIECDSCRCWFQVCCAGAVVALWWAAAARGVEALTAHPVGAVWPRVDTACFDVRATCSPTFLFFILAHLGLARQVWVRPWHAGLVSGSAAV